MKSISSNSAFNEKVLSLLEESPCEASFAKARDKFSSMKYIRHVALLVNDKPIALLGAGDCETALARAKRIADNENIINYVVSHTGHRPKVRLFDGIDLESFPDVMVVIAPKLNQVDFNAFSEDVMYFFLGKEYLDMALLITAMEEIQSVLTQVPVKLSHRIKVTPDGQVELHGDDVIRGSLRPSSGDSSDEAHELESHLPLYEYP